MSTRNLSQRKGGGGEVRGSFSRDAQEAMPSPFSTSAVGRGFSPIRTVKSHHRIRLGVGNCGRATAAALRQGGLDVDEFCKEMAGAAD